MKTFQVSKPTERKFKENDLFYFLHIPKTAGTTVYFTLDSYFDLDSIFPYRFWNRYLMHKPKLESNIFKNFYRFQFVRGHFGYGMCRLFLKKPRIVTLLRKPIERTISDYNHRIRGTDPKYSKKLPISKFFQDYEQSKTFENVETYHIGLDPDILSITKSFDRKKCKEFRFREELPYLAEEIPKTAILETAKKRLTEFEFVGIAEKLQQSLFLLYYTFGWQPLSRPWMLNPTPKKLTEEIPQKTIDTIREFVTLDTELYKFACDLFDNRYSKMVKILKEKYYENSLANLSEGEMMYTMLQKHYEKGLEKSKLTPINALDYDFRSKMSGSGWYYREIIKESGDVFRWTGPETESIIDFPLTKDEDLMIQFRVMRAILPKILSSLKFKVNDQPVDIKNLYEKSGKTIFEGLIPKSILEKSKFITRLKFEINQTINPHEINPLDKTNRPLGLAFDRIRIIPAKVYDRKKDLIETSRKGQGKKNLRGKANQAALKIGIALRKKGKH